MWMENCELRYNLVNKLAVIEWFIELSLKISKLK